MKFLRWYWELTKKILPVHNKDDKTFFLLKRLSNFFIWYFVTIFLSIVFGFAVSGLWYSLPASVREFIARTAITIWTYIVIFWAHLVAIATAVWAFVKPFFDWLNSLDWVGAAHKVDRLMYQASVAALHLIIGLFATMIAMTVVSLIVDYVEIFLLGEGLKKEKRPIVIICFAVSTLFGFYVTTSSYSVSAVSWFASWYLPH